jgi:pentatricopeptide repeat protein
MLLGTDLVNTYGKCDSVVDVHCYLNEMPENNAVSWGSVISVYVKHEHCEDTWKMFMQMQNYTSF